MTYLNSLGQDYKKSPEKWTGNQVLDMLLNYKKSMAEAKGIEVKIASELISLPFAEKETIVLYERG